MSPSSRSRDVRRSHPPLSLRRGDPVVRLSSPMGAVVATRTASGRSPNAKRPLRSFRHRPLARSTPLIRACQACVRRHDLRRAEGQSLEHSSAEQPTTADSDAAAAAPPPVPKRPPAPPLTTLPPVAASPTLPSAPASQLDCAPPNAPRIPAAKQVHKATAAANRIAAAGRRLPPNSSIVGRTRHMRRPMEQRYDQIGVGYTDRRQPDPRLATDIHDALGDAESIVNVGAGTGSYEPRDRPLVAVEPSIAMIRQRSRSAAPAVRACAEELPFADGAFGASLAVLTIHHWSNWRAGLHEMVRVSRRRVVLFTWDPASENSWLREYFPHLVDSDRLRFPGLTALREILGDIEVLPVRVPHDCTDGFMGAYWRRPSAYLDPRVRGAISSLSTGESSVSLAHLADDLSTGTWERKHGQVLKCEDLDVGYRLVIASLPSNMPSQLRRAGQRSVDGQLAGAARRSR